MKDRSQEQNQEITIIQNNKFLKLIIKG